MTGGATASSAAVPGQSVQTETVSVSDVHPMGHEESVMRVLAKGTTYTQEFPRTSR